LLQDGICRLFKEKQWDEIPFITAYDYVLNNKYQNQWVWKKPISNPSRKFKAEVFCVHDVDVFSMYVRVYNKSGDLVC